MKINAPQGQRIRSLGFKPQEIDLHQATGRKAMAGYDG